MSNKSKGPPFAKLDGGFYSNRKVIRAGRNGRELFLHVLCCNTKRGAKGFVPIGDIEPWYVARELGITEADVSDGVTKAVTAKLIEIDGDEVSIVGWDGDWAWRPLTRAEIQKNYRERRADANRRYENEVTELQPSNALPVEEIREEERESALPRKDSLSGFSPRTQIGTGSEPATETGKRTRKRPEASPSLDEWRPSAALTAVAVSLGCDPEHELTNFRLHARARRHSFSTLDSLEAAFEKFVRGSRDVGKSARNSPPLAAKTGTRRLRMEDGSVWEIGEDDEPIRCLEAGT